MEYNENEEGLRLSSAFNLQDFQTFLQHQVNPFDDAIVGDLWQAIVDVPEINKQITDQLLATIQAVQDSKKNRIFLVLGQPGSGKSHVLARIQRKSEDFHQFLFVYVTPMNDLSKFNQHILRQLMVSLLKDMGDRPLKPLFRFTIGIILGTILKIQNSGRLQQEYFILLDQLKKSADPIELLEGILEKQSKTARDALFELVIGNIVRNKPQIDASFLRVLFHLLDEDLETRVIDWLKGVDCPEEDLKNIRATKSLDSEDRAREVLHSIFSLAQGPILLCFDQIENIFDRFNDQGGTTFFFNALMDYFNQFPNLAIILACNTSIWSEKISPAISGSARDRITDVGHLKSLTREEATLLVKTRMEPLWASWAKTNPVVPYPTFPFTEGFIHHVAKNGGWNPRSIIKQMQETFNHAKLDTPFIEFVAPVEGTEPSTVTPPIPEPRIEAVQLLLKEELAKQSQEILGSEIKPMISTEWEDQLTGFLKDLFAESKKKSKAISGSTITSYEANWQPVKTQKPFAFQVQIGGTADEHGAASCTETRLVQITNSSNGTSLAATLRRIKEQIDKNPGWIGLLLRKEDLIIGAKFAASQALINEMGTRLVVKNVRDTTASIFFALKRMLEAATAGDLQVGEHRVTRGEMVDFLFVEIEEQDLLSEILPGLGSGIKVSTRTTPSQPEPKETSPAINQPAPVRSPTLPPPTQPAPVPVPILSPATQPVPVQTPAPPPAAQPKNQPNAPAQVQQEIPVKIPGDASTLVQKVLGIAKSMKVINLVKLSSEIKIPRDELERACSELERKGQVTRLSVSSEDIPVYVYRPPSKIEF